MAFVLIIGEAERFQCSKQVASYLGLVPLEDCSGTWLRTPGVGQVGNLGNGALEMEKPPVLTGGSSLTRTD